MSTEHTADHRSVTDSHDGSAPGCACWSRRQSLAVAGLAVAGTAGLAACGSNTGGSASGGGSVASGAGQAIAKADIPVGGGKVFQALQAVVTQPTAGDYKAFSAICTHQGCTVDVSNGVIACPCHGSLFDLATGAVLQGPATQALPPKSVKIGADGITVT